MKYLLILLLTITSLQAQERYVYASFFADPNNLLGVIDNPRTEVESTGLDYDVEIGARTGRVNVYLFYGAFNQIDYQNLGWGADYNVSLFKKVDASIGFNQGYIIREFYNRSHTYIAFACRQIVTIKLTNNIDLPLKLQYQHRPDINVFGIFEGSIGLTFKLNR